MGENPYQDLPPEHFWRSGVAEASSPPPNLYRPKWPLPKTAKIATAGSCFAQHIGRHLRANGYNIMDVEPPPPGLAPEHRARFGFGIYSARYGNIYTARQLLQLAQEAFGKYDPGDIAWRKGPRYFDALRPGVEPEGLGSPEEVRAHRKQHLARVRDLLQSAGVFVFTLGLTECWTHKGSGAAYPTVPGSIAGAFDPSIHAFRNFGFRDIYDDFLSFRALVHEAQGHDRIKFLLTVSPVPLTATASGKHVLQATIHSKSVLRAVAGELEASLPDVDYFPSFEIVTNPWSHEDLFDANRRTVTEAGVATVMQTFTNAQAGASNEPAAPISTAAETPAALRDDTIAICEEELLEAFATAQ